MIDREDLDSFEVTSAVVHYVPTDRDDPESDLLLTDGVIDLSGGLDSYFRDKIVERLKGKGLEVLNDPDGNPCVPDAVDVVDADTEGLIEASHRIAVHLDSIQSAVNSSGLLAVVHGQLHDRSCLAILKLERERGVRFAISTVDGRHTVDLELLRNLTLTDKTKVYKTALLAASSTGQVEGLVADDQRGTGGGRQIAGFFLSEFLGCKPRVPAAQTTFAFVKAANESFNNDVPSPERQGRYQVALLAEMQSTTADIRPSTFATQHLDPLDRQPLLNRVREAGVDPSAFFAKDTSLVKASRFKMTFTSGMVLVGSRESLDENVQLPEDAASGEPVKLNDTVQNLLAGK